MTILTSSSTAPNLFVSEVPSYVYGVYRWCNDIASYCPSYVSHDASLITHHGCANVGERIQQSFSSPGVKINLIHEVNCLAVFVHANAVELETSTLPPAFTGQRGPRACMTRRGAEGGG